MRRRVLVGFAVVVALGASTVASGAGRDGGGAATASGGVNLKKVNWERRMRAAKRVARKRAGKISFSVRGGGVKRSFDGADRYHSASVVKAMLLVAYLRKHSDRALRDSERERLKIMIRRSHNGAATEVRDEVGNGALEAIADKLGFRCFATASSWGATEICSRDMALLMKRIERLLPSRHRKLAMGFLKRIVTKQRWGIPEVTGWTPFFKGGWYDYAPGAWRVHQIALLRGPEGEELAVAILGRGQKSKKYGIATVRKVANQLIGPVTRD